MFYVPPNLVKKPQLRSDIHILGNITLLNVQSPVFSVDKTSILQNHVISSIINNTNVFCIGPEKSGKTSACLLAALQLVKDKGIKVVYLTTSVEVLVKEFEVLKKEVNVNFDPHDSISIVHSSANLVNVENKMIVLDDAEGYDVEKALSAMKKVSKVVLVSNEKITIPAHFTDENTKFIEIKALRESRPDRDKNRTQGKKLDRKSNTPPRKYDGRPEAGENDRDREGRKKQGSVAPYNTSPRSSLAGMGDKHMSENASKSRGKKEPPKKNVEHVILQSKDPKEDLLNILRSANVKKTWRSNEPIDNVAVYGGLRHVINNIEGALKSLDLKYSLFDKKARDKESSNILVIPEGSKKPSTRRFDIVINYSFPETFEEYESRAENTRKVISFIDNIDEGFKRKLGKLLKENNQRVPSMLDVQSSFIEEFDAFHIESEKEEVSDSDLWV